jgi:small-conductance mechanosensitive channel
VLTGFGPSSIDFSVRAWTYEFDQWVAIRTDLGVRVHDALRAAGIAIPFPQQDVHLRTVPADLRRALQPGDPDRDRA